MTLFNETLNDKESTNIAANNTQLKTTNTTPKVEAIKGWLIDKLAEILEIEPNQIDVTLDFEAYGLESSEVINLSDDLEDYLNCRLATAFLQEYQNIEVLAQYLATGNFTLNEPESSGFQALSSIDTDVDQDIEELKQAYNFDLKQQEEIKNFLRKNKEIIEVLKIAKDEIKKRFRNETLYIEYEDGEEYEDGGELALSIETKKNIDEALKQLSDFEDNWWTDKWIQINSKLSIDVRFIK